ncbi:MAG: RNA 2',3'-cyclic phosphodiesterase [Myxococcota bacterium]
MGSVRAFIAVELPPTLRQVLDELTGKLRAGTPPRVVKWVPADNLHLTLKFLGQMPVEQQEELVGKLHAVAKAHAPFALTLTSLGCFPSARKPHVIWVGIAERNLDRLRALHHDVEEALVPLGYPAEERDFSPHLTLGRVSRDARGPSVRALGEVLGNHEVGELGELTVGHLALMRSDTQPGGARYTRMAHIPLAQSVVAGVEVDAPGR